MGKAVKKLPWIQQIFNATWDPIQALSFGQASSVPGANNPKLFGMEPLKTTKQVAESHEESDKKLMAAESAKVAEEKAKADKEAADAAEKLAFRRRSSSQYATSRRGVLGGAGTSQKVLLG